MVVCSYTLREVFPLRLRGEVVCCFGRSETLSCMGRLALRLVVWLVFDWFVLGGVISWWCVGLRLSGMRTCCLGAFGAESVPDKA
jgi:hypothetical protein